jgi:hypothetical protein
MTFLHEGHEACLHVCLMPGVVYCYDSEAIFIDVTGYIKYLERGDYRVLPITAFVEASLRGRNLIGRAPFRAYVWLAPDTPFRGLQHTSHTMRDVFKRMDEAKP